MHCAILKYVEINRTKIALLGITIFGLLLRIYNLNKYDFWYDEAFSLIIVKYYTAQALFNLIKVSTDSELFGFLLYFWTTVIRNESLFRLLPLILGILSFFLIHSLGKKLFNNKIGLISAFLLAVSPFHIYYSQELRSYSLFMFLSLLSVYYLLRVLTEKKSALWAGFIISNILCLYSHKSSIFFLLFENIYFIFLCDNRKKLLLKWSISQLIILIFYTPILIKTINLIYQLNILTVFRWVPPPSVQTVINTFNIFNLGYYGAKNYILGSLIFFPAFLFGVYYGIKDKKKVYLLLIWLFIPIITVILISLIKRQGSLYLQRTFINLLPAYLIIVANGIGSIKNKLLPPVLFIIIALSIAALADYYNGPVPQPKRLISEVYSEKEYKTAANYVKKYFKKDDVVAHTSLSSIPSFIYYHKNEIEEKWVYSKESGISDTLWCSWWTHLFQKYPDLFQVTWLKSFLSVEIKQLLSNHRRIWLVYSGWDSDDRESPRIKKWLDNNLTLLKKAEFNGIDVYLYTMKIQSNINVY